jgi:hypothetical protein
MCRNQSTKFASRQSPQTQRSCPEGAFHGFRRFREGLRVAMTVDVGARIEHKMPQDLLNDLERHPLSNHQADGRMTGGVKRPSGKTCPGQEGMPDAEHVARIYGSPNRRKDEPGFLPVTAGGLPFE